MSLIKGIHHVALRPTYAQFEKAKTFYLDLLGLKVVRQWGDEKYPCMMISTGDNSCIEVLPVPEENDVPLEGKFAHLALATDDTDGCVARVREAGYEITIEPKDVELSDITARIAFCTGSFMAVRTNVFKEIGGFDPAYFMYVEDADLTQKMRTRGKAYLVPQYTAIHAWHRAAHRDLKPALWQTGNLLKYFHKWGFKW